MQMTKSHIHTTLLGVLLLATVLRPLAAAGQRSDSLTCRYDHRLTWGQTVAPTLLLAGGATVAFTPSLHDNIDIKLRDWLQLDGHKRYEAENVLQYVPISSVVLLKACGLESRHNWRDMVCLGAGSALFTVLFSNGLKYTICRERPYPGVFTSFPSGHTMTAFFGAEMLRREYAEEYPAIAITGYAVATGVGLLRMYNNRHWASDVLAGAGLGILSTSLMYWLAPYLQF